MRAFNYRRRKASLPRAARVGFESGLPPAPRERPLEESRRFPGIATHLPDPPPVPRVELDPIGYRDVLDGRD